MNLVKREAIKMVKDTGKKELTKDLNIVKNTGRKKLSQTLENKPSSQTKNSFGTGVKKKSKKIIKTVSTKIEMGPLGKAKRTIEEFIKVIFFNKHGKYTSKLSEKQKQLELKLFNETHVNNSIDELMNELTDDIFNDINNSIDISIDDFIKDIIIDDPEILKEYISQ
jgi:hypothetical protein